MRPTYYEGPDTLQGDRLPTGRLTLAYRPRLPKGAAAITGAAVLAIVLISLLLTLAARISGFLISPTVAILFIISGPIAGVVLLIQRKHWRIALAATPVGALAWLLLAFLHVSSSPRFIYFVGFGPVLAAALWIADAIAGHHLRWMAAHPRFRFSAHAKWSHRWRYRFAVPAYRAAFEYALVAYAIPAILFLPPDKPLTPHPLRAAFLVLVVTALLLAGAVLVILRSPRSARSLSRRLTPLVNWFTYSSHPYALGLLRIRVVPFGCVSGLSRKVLTGVVLFLLTASMASTACYFPITMVSASRWQAMAEIPSDQMPKTPTTQETAQRLTAAQRSYLDRVPIAYRLRYLDLTARRQQLDAIAAAKTHAYEELLGYVNSAPEAWLPVLARQIPSSSAFVISTLFASITLSALCPIAVFVAIVVIVNLPLLDHLEPRLAAGFHHQTDWDGYVDRIQRSEHETERESLWLGTHADADYPILLDRTVLQEHAHILGDSGSGKTALALAPMAAQLIRMAGRDARLPASENNPHSSIVIIDLKGDLALFHGARIEAEKAGLPFQWFTNTLHCSTFAFNPFLQTHFAALSLNQRTEIIADALALSHGEGYGRSYFSRVNRRILSRMLHAYGQNIRSFRDLYGETLTPETLGRKLKFQAKETEDAGELFATLETLSTFDAINETRTELVAHQIDMHEVVTNPRVVYFFLQSAIESASVREIGKLALYCLLSAAARRGPANHQVYLFIDEFQQIASENLEIILRQARSMGIAAILANQTISDLETPAANLIPTVQGNTRFKQFFASTDLKQQDDLIKASGVTIDYIQHWSRNGDSEPSREVEIVQPRISRNDLIRITDDSTLSIVHMPRGKGCAQMAGFPFVCRSDFHISEEVYSQRQRLEWPPRTLGTLTPTSQSLYEPVTRQTKKSVPVADEHACHGARPAPASDQLAPANVPSGSNARQRRARPPRHATPPDAQSPPSIDTPSKAGMPPSRNAFHQSDAAQNDAETPSAPETPRQVEMPSSNEAASKVDSSTDATVLPAVATEANGETPSALQASPVAEALLKAETSTPPDRPPEPQVQPRVEKLSTPEANPEAEAQPRSEGQSNHGARPSMFASRFEELESRRREREELQRHRAQKLRENPSE